MIVACILARYLRRSIDRNGFNFFGFSRILFEPKFYRKPKTQLRITKRCKNSTHFPRVVNDQTMDQTAREKRTLQFMRGGRVRLHIEREGKNILVKSIQEEYRVTQKKRNPIPIILNTRGPFLLGHPVE